MLSQETTKKNADDFACDLLKDSNIDPKHLASFFKKLRVDARSERIMKYMSTHPVTEERIVNAMNHSKDFEKNKDKPSLGITLTEWKKLKKPFEKQVVIEWD